MDFVNTWQSIAGNGFMFWSATAAVALGTTLILASGFVQVRRLCARTERPVATAPATLPEPAAEADDISLGREMKVESQNVPAGSVSGSVEQNSRELLLLLARLRSVSDRLDDFRRTYRYVPLDWVESPLKDSRDGVDYLFRTGTG